MSNYAIALDWERCPDGVELFRAEAPQAGGLLEMITGTPAPPPESVEVFAYRTKRRNSYRLEAGSLPVPLFVEFINAKSVQDKIVFLSKYGLPAKTLAQSMATLEFNTIDFVEAIYLYFDLMVGSFNRGDGALAVMDFRKFAQVDMNALSADLILRPGASRPSLSIMPASLFGFMLVELASVMSGDTRAMRCAHCGTLFTSGMRGEKRRGALYCSNRCRVASQRATAAGKMRKLVAE